MERLFTAPDAWLGGFFELALDLGPPDDDRWSAALAALWAHPVLDGCYAECDREPWAQPRVAPVLPAGGEGGNQLLGVATLPNGRRAVCASVSARYAGYEGCEDIDTLCLCLPMASLGRAYPVGTYPLAHGALLGWRAEVEAWLRAIGEAVFAAVGFRLGLVGFEAEGMVTPAEVRANGVPGERWFGYLWPDGERLGWYPATLGAPITLGPA